jgi:hypothetical protein
MKQVNLLAHLLAQNVDNEGKINKKIPKKIKKYVDLHIVNNILTWSKTI